MSSSPARRRNRWIVGALAGACAGAGIAIALLAAPSTPPERAVELPSDAPQVPQVTAIGQAPSQDHSVYTGIPVGKAILTSTVDTLEVFDAPGGTVTRGLDRYTRYSLPLTLLAIDSREAGGETWYEALLPAKPNGQTGWVKASDVTVTSTDTVIHVYLAERQLDVVVGGEVAMTAPVAVGAPATPTPLGTFYITDPIDLTARPSAVYGDYALGLSGYSEALDSFKGTLPQIAIHGTNAPNMIGQPVSNGCLRMKNDAVRDVASRVGLGTPVIISASRADA
ncbi:MAG: L,D-transpeptidase [Demequinaceae bacterium]|nr:L,D-transpeptidase [Demequinaceae bacterium]